MTEPAKNRTENWQRTRRIQMNAVRMVGLALLALVLVLEAVLLGPVSNTLRLRDLDESSIQAELVLRRVNTFFSQAIDLVLQIPSRTRIREELVAYLTGRTTLEDMAAFSAPKLADAVDASPGIVAVYRFGPDQEPLVGAYMEPGDLPPPVFGNEPHVLAEHGVIGEVPVIFVTVPILHDGFGLAGYDAVAVSLEPLESWITADEPLDGNASILFLPPGAATLADTVFPASLDDCRLQLLCGIAPPAAPYEYVAGSHIWSYQLPDGWSLAVVRDSRSVHERSRREIIFLGIIVFVIGAVAGSVVLWLLRLFSRRTLAETDELDRIVAEQTEELKMMIDEVHHRVKNDIYLTNTFLELKAMESGNPVVRDIIADATGSLRVMAELYDILHAAHGQEGIPLRGLMGKIVDRIRGGTDRRATTISTDIADEHIDRRIARSLSIIVNELLTNAVKYARPAGDSLEIRLKVLTTEDGQCQVTLSDNGAGFPQTVLDGEYGFGLTLVKTMATRFGGEIVLENAPGGTVHLKLNRPPGKISASAGAPHGN